MSVQSLPRLLSGEGVKKARENGHKYSTLPAKAKATKLAELDEIMMKRQKLNRNGSIGRLQFRGIKKEFFDKQASLIAHSMTVKLIGLL